MGKIKVIDGRKMRAIITHSDCCMKQVSAPHLLKGLGGSKLWFQHGTIISNLLTFWENTSRFNNCRSIRKFIFVFLLISISFVVVISCLISAVSCRSEKQTKELLIFILFILRVYSCYEKNFYSNDETFIIIVKLFKRNI